MKNSGYNEFGTKGRGVSCWFYYKTEVDGDLCYEEEMEDSSQVPLWEGKILVQCRLVE